MSCGWCYTCFEIHRTSNINLHDLYYDLSAQRLMVKAKEKIRPLLLRHFCVTVYNCWSIVVAFSMYEQNRQICLCKMYSGVLFSKNTKKSSNLICDTLRFCECLVNKLTRNQYFEKFSITDFVLAERWMIIQQNPTKCKFTNSLPLTQKS